MILYYRPQNLPCDYQVSCNLFCLTDYPILYLQQDRLREWNPSLMDELTTFSCTGEVTGGDTFGSPYM